MEKPPNRSRRTVTRPTTTSNSKKTYGGGTSRNTQRARRERARRRRRHVLIFRVICCILVCLAAVLATTVFFRVSQGTISGDTRYTADELVAASGVQNGDNMLFLNKKQIASALEEQCPYLDTVEVHRKMPSTVEIAVTDRTAVLSVETDDGYLLMDSTGKVLEVLEEVQAGTAVAYGTETEGLEVGDTAGEDQEKLLLVLDLMEMMTEYEMNENVISIDMEKAYDVTMQYTENYTVLLGNMDNMEHQIQFLQAILKEPSLPESGIIDLTDDTEARYRPADTTTTDTEDDTADAEEASDADSDSETSDSDADSTADDTEQTADSGSEETQSETSDGQ